LGAGRTINEWKSLKRRVFECESQVQAPKDKSHDNLERQGFDLRPDPLNTWKTTQKDTIRQKAVFDMQPTNPELDIQPTGKYEVWIREIKLLKSSWQGQKLTALIQKFLHALQTMPLFHVSQMLQGLVYTFLMENVLVY